MDSQTRIVQESRVVWDDGSVSRFDPPVWVIYVNGRRPSSPSHVQDTEDDALEALFPFFAWPGGYPMEYVTDGGDVLCAECARATYRGDGCDDQGYVCEGFVIEEQCDYNLTCDQCSRVIAEQNWCSIHGRWDSYDVFGDPDRPNIVTEMRDACSECHPELFDREVEA